MAKKKPKNPQRLWSCLISQRSKTIHVSLLWFFKFHKTQISKYWAKKMAERSFLSMVTLPSFGSTINLMKSLPSKYYLLNNCITCFFKTSDLFKVIANSFFPSKCISKWPSPTKKRAEDQLTLAQYIPSWTVIYSFHTLKGTSLDRNSFF